MDRARGGADNSADIQRDLKADDGAFVGSRAQKFLASTEVWA